jgi:electron transfer DM13
MSRTRLSVTALILVSLGGLAAGLLLARGSGAEPGVKGRPGVLASGRFTSIEWPTSGKAMIVRRGDGSLKLELRNLQTQDAPELYLFIAPTNGTGGTRRKIADLRAVTGNQEYDLPADVARDLHQAVMIWCGKCHKYWGAAHLRLTSLHQQTS